MEERDLADLTRLVKEYPIGMLLSCLEKAIANQADELVDLGMGHSDQTKELTLAAWHLHLLTGSLD